VATAKPAITTSSEPMGAFPNPGTPIPLEEQTKTAAPTLVQDGKLLFEMGKLDEAEAKLKAASKADPSNQAAYYYLNLLNEKRFDEDRNKRDVRSREKLLEVEHAWYSPGASNLPNVGWLGQVEQKKKPAAAATVPAGGAKPPEVVLALPVTPTTGLTADGIDDYSPGPLMVTNATNLVVWSAAVSGVANVPEGQYRLYYDLNRNPKAPGLSGPSLASAPQSTAVDEAILRQATKLSKKESAARTPSLEEKLVENDGKITLTGITSVSGEPTALMKFNTPGANTNVNEPLPVFAFDDSVATNGTAGKREEYDEAKRKLEVVLAFRQLLHEKLAQEKTDEALPKHGAVILQEYAEPATNTTFSLWQKLLGKDKYQANARVSLARDQSDRSDIAGLSGTNTSGMYDPYFIQTEFELLRSEVILGKVAKDLDLAKQWGGKRSGGQPLTAAETVKLLKNSLELNPIKNTETLEINVRDQDAQEAAKIANAIAKTYSDFRQERRQELSARGITTSQTALDNQEEEVLAAQSNVDRLRPDASSQSRLDLAAAANTAPEDTLPAGEITFQQADLTQVLDIYAKLVHRTVLRPANLAAQNIVLKTETPLTKREAVEALDAVLGMNGIAMIDVGKDSVKAVPLAQVNQEAGAFNKQTAEQLADLSPYVTHVVQLKNAKPTEVEPFLKSLASISNSILAIDKSGIIVLRDKPEVVRQLLEVIREKDSDKAAPATPRPAPSADAPVPQPEFQTHDNAFSTFSMNVSDVSFKLAAASLEKGMLPEPASVRSEEFINAFDYRDPEAPPGVPVAFAYDRAGYPFAQNRDLLRFSLKTAAEGREPGRPLNLVLLLDTSGSMERADRVRIIHEALRVLASQLTPNDVFSVVTFARTPRLWVDGIPGHQAGKVAEDVGNLTPEGGTNLEEAMNLAYQTALRHYLANGVNRVVLLTDGAANLGNVDPANLKQKVEANRKQGISLDCFGVGWEGYNDDLLELLTRDGNGRYGFINTPEEAATDFAGQLAGALRVAAADVKVQVEFNPSRVTAYRQIGYAKHQLTKEQFRDNTVAAAQLAASESGNALYVVEVNPHGEGPLCTVRVRYRVPATSEYHEHEWAVPYTGNAPALDQSAPAMRLSATAAAFSEWLAASPYATDVTPERLLGYLSGVPEICGADARPKKLQWMLRQAQSIEGKR
jgi:Mg-chelatase subunit ChlD/capsular polysaccharide biosynthesis protein